MTEEEARRNRRDTIDRLVHLVDRISQFWPGVAAKIDKTSALAAKQFLRALPESAQLPKIAPEGEGGVLFMWEQGPPSADATIIIDGFTMHTICAPGLPSAVYAENIPFDGVEIPETVLAIIPSAKRRRTRESEMTDDQAVQLALILRQLTVEMCVRLDVIEGRLRLLEASSAERNGGCLPALFAFLACVASALILKKLYFG